MQTKSLDRSLNLVYFVVFYGIVEHSLIRVRETDAVYMKSSSANHIFV